MEVPVFGLVQNDVIQVIVIIMQTTSKAPVSLSEYVKLIGSVPNGVLAMLKKAW